MGTPIVTYSHAGVHTLLSHVEKGVHSAEEVAEAKKAADAARAAATAAAASVPAAAQQPNARMPEREPGAPTAFLFVARLLFLKSGAENLLLNAATAGDVATVRQLVAEGYVAPVPRDAMKINTPLYVVRVPALTKDLLLFPYCDCAGCEEWKHRDG